MGTECSYLLFFSRFKCFLFGSFVIVGAVVNCIKYELSSGESVSYAFKHFF